VCGDPNSVLRFAFVEFTDEGTCFFLLEHSFTVALSHSVSSGPRLTHLNDEQRVPEQR
jgi:hypothetical protein